MSLPLSREGGREGKREGGREGGRDWRKQVCKPWTVGVTTRQRGRKGWRRRMTGTGIMTRREGEREGRGKERKNRDGFDFSSYLRYVIYFSDSVDGEGGEEGWKVKDSAVERIAVSYGIGRREGGRGGGGEGGRAGRRYDYARLLELERSEKKAIRKEKLAAQGEEKEREGGRKGGKEEESRAVVINSFLPPSLHVQALWPQQARPRSVGKRRRRRRRRRGGKRGGRRWRKPLAGTEGSRVEVDDDGAFPPPLPPPLPPPRPPSPLSRLAFGACHAAYILPSLPSRNTLLSCFASTPSA
jgi:hypothetical protein